MPEPWTWLGRVWLCHFGQRPTSFLVQFLLLSNGVEVPGLLCVPQL